MKKPTGNKLSPKPASTLLHSSSSLYSPLPNQAHNSGNVGAHQGSSNAALSLVQSLVSSPSAKDKSFETKVQSKTLLMDNVPMDPMAKQERKLGKKKARKRKRVKALSQRQKRALGLNEIPVQDLK